MLINNSKSMLILNSLFPFNSKMQYQTDCAAAMLTHNTLFQIEMM